MRLESNVQLPEYLVVFAVISSCRKRVLETFAVVEILESVRWKEGVSYRSGAKISDL